MFLNPARKEEPDENLPRQLSTSFRGPVYHNTRLVARAHQLAYRAYPRWHWFDPRSESSRCIVSWYLIDWEIFENELLSVLSMGHAGCVKRFILIANRSF